MNDIYEVIGALCILSVAGAAIWLICSVLERYERFKRMQEFQRLFKGRYTYHEYPEPEKPQNDQATAKPD